MYENLGLSDRTLRISVGAGLIVAVVVLTEGPLRWLVVAGVALLLTGVSGTCPLYALLRTLSKPGRAER
jgi:hypothetical protein